MVSLDLRALVPDTAKKIRNTQQLTKAVTETSPKSIPCLNHQWPSGVSWEGGQQFNKKAIYIKKKISPANAKFPQHFGKVFLRGGMSPYPLTSVGPPPTLKTKVTETVAPFL